MKRMTYFLLSILSICLNITGCQSVAGNVIPETGPTMEEVYDSMNGQKVTANMHTENNTEMDLTELRETKLLARISPVSEQQTTPNIQTFKKLPNPELKLYVYPHFAGSDEVPIPGYFTVLNAYEKTHYALPSESMY